MEQAMTNGNGIRKLSRPTPTSCYEWVERNHILHSLHEWEHHRDGSPTHCSLCGMLYSEFENRADHLHDMYLEAYSE